MIWFQSFTPPPLDISTCYSTYYKQILSNNASKSSDNNGINSTQMNQHEPKSDPQNLFGQHFRCVHNGGGAECSQFFTASEAPSHSDSSDSGIRACLHVHIRVSNVDSLLF